MRSPFVITALAASATLTLSGCIGSGGGPAEVKTSLDYSPAIGQHSYEPHETPSDVHWWTTATGSTERRIGPDVAPREPLRHVLTDSNDIRYFMGASRDGVGVDRLENYEQDLLTSDGDDPYGISGSGFLPFIIKPHVIVDLDLMEPENAEIMEALWNSVYILNDALPPEFQLGVYTPRPGYSIGPGDIFVHLERRGSPTWGCNSSQAVACATNQINTVFDYTRWAEIWLPNDLDTSDWTYMNSTILHELLHALGIVGHVDSIEFPDSIMGTAGETIPNLGYLISRIDREILQVMYMSQETDTYNDWGEWSDLSHHLMGQTGDDAMSFGVALFNGLPQPWVHGVEPSVDLADNRRLFGTATWNGALMAYSGPSPLFGSASLQVGLAALNNPASRHDLRFRDIYYVNRYASDSPDRWFHTRDIDYEVTIFGNAFENVGDEQGHVTGAFFGTGHEHMGGTVKRTDLVGAFGGRR